MNNMLLNNEWVNNEIKEETKGYLETNENENTSYGKRQRRALHNDNGMTTMKGYAIVNIYSPNNGAPNMTDIKGETDTHELIVGNFNTH